ncbi:General transcription factor 3C polypeptide 5 [Smittium mucronatum]|uniref:General transcription factor 3C polypeptide 5 n=1 Tax=Smittium mucronatum TaxID=133383 RepID=A0A1R0GWK2_9FUNG|nr:General transcription factor 3C polypeptide 5 [Smittium mucronatum]
MASKKDDLLAERHKIPEKILYNVEYPGCVINIDKALKTLGGVDRIYESVSGKNKLPVELRYQPNSPSLIPLLGEPIPTSNVLIKVKRKLKKYKDGRIEEFEPNNNSWKVEIVGWVVKTIRFRVSDSIPELIDEFKNSWGEYSRIPFPVMTRNNFPLIYGFKQHSFTKEEMIKKGDILVPSVTIGSNIKKKYSIVRVMFEDVSPTSPITQLDSIRSYLNMDLFEFFKKKFDEKPVWTRNDLEKNYPPGIDFNIYQIRSCLSILGFYMDSGPWRDLWVKFGYDMRKTRDSYIYQQVNIRRKVYNKANIALQNPKKSDFFNTQEGDENYDANVISGTGKSSSDAMYLLENKNLIEAQEKFGIKLGTIMLSDVKIKKVVKILEHPRILLPECTRESGWIRPDILLFIKQQIKEKINEATDLDEAYVMASREISNNHSPMSFVRKGSHQSSSGRTNRNGSSSNSKARLHIEDVNKILRDSNGQDINDGYNSINDDSDISDF